MTELAYQLDATIREFDAEVVAHAGGGLVLDRTHFYPGGGGQPCDLGTLSFDGHTLPVERVGRHEGSFVHWITEGHPLPDAGTRVRGVIDWERRHALMRTHTALHVLCGILWRDQEALSTGCGMQPGAAHIDFALESVDGEMLERLEKLANQEIAQGRPIHVSIQEREQAEQIPGLIKTKTNLIPDHLTHLRVVEIEGLDVQADGGTHVTNTADIGPLRIVRYKSKGRQNKRLYIELD